jgi:ribosomal protein S18 acetylase RimI-like enzyme
MKLTIAPYERKKHAEGLARLDYQDWHSTYQNLLSEEILSKATYEKTLAKAKRIQGLAFVALDGANVIGFVRGEIRHKKGESIPEIVSLFVQKEYQGHGLGRALVSKCLESFKEERAILYVLEGSEHAESFYRNVGFERTGLIRTEKLFGIPVKEFQMALKR